MRRLLLLSLLAIAAARYVDYAREKRDIEYHEWLTESQKSELKQLKESADHAALKKRTMELYELLPAEQKEKWNAKYKDMCVAWIKETATEEENANYKKWKEEGNMGEITAQYKKLKARLSEEKRKDVELWESECWELWKDEFPAASRGRRSVMDLAEEKLSFLGADKIAELKALKESGASDDVIRDKVVSWTIAHWQSKDSKVSTADFVNKCYGWIKDVTGAEEYAAFEKLHHTDHEACRVKVREFLARLPLDKQAQVEKSLPLCDAIWYKQHQEEHGSHGGHDGHEHHAHKHHVKRHLNTMHIEKFMTWMSKEQKEEIHKLEKAGESYESLVAKMKGWYEELEGDKKDDVREDIKDKCAEWVYAKTTESEQYDLRDFIQQGDKDAFLDALKKPYSRLTDDEKHEVDHTKDFCIALWTTAPSRRRRDHHEEYKEYFSWLTPEQGAEVKALREAGKQEEVYTKMEQFYDALGGDKKHEATEKLKGACKHFFKSAFGAEAVEEIKQMKESGSSMDEVAAKVNDLIEKITDEKKKAVATRASNNCKKIFSASRRRRDHHEEYKQYFSWLTPEQGAELKALREAGNEDEAYTKTLEIYEGLAGDKKTEATEKLKGACKLFFTNVFGAAAVEELKQMKETGASMDEIGEKVEGLIEKITDEKKKATATLTSVNCKKVFSASRKRRDHHHDHHEQYKQYFTWLTPEQGAEVKELGKAGNHEQAYTKIMGWHEELSGDKKTEATEKLKGACKHFFKDTFGEAATEEIKAMKESGASMDDIADKVSEFIEKITDEKKKTIATRASANCKKIFTAARKRRDHHHDHHEQYKEYFTWLTPEQGAEVKELGKAGNHEQAYTKIMGWHEELSGDKKTEATEKLKGACKHFFKDTFGEAATEEIKAMKESGASMDDIADKISEFIEKITDEKKKTIATRASANCKKIFTASRKRRDHHHDHHEQYKQYFTWLTPEQGAEVKELGKAGNHEQAYTKIMGWHEELSGDKKTEATEKLKGACKHFFKDTFGEAATEEIKAMKESGASMDDIADKVSEFIEKITDEKKKTIATRASANCKKIFSASRKRRDHHDEYAAYKDYFTWLTPEQGAEVKKLHDAGDEDAVDKKLHEFFTALAGDKKTEAAQKLKGACKHYFKDIFGEAAAEELKEMKESGASMDEIAKRVEGLIDKIGDEKKKAKASKAAVNCKKLFGASRRRRDHHDEFAAYKEYFTWLTPEQGAEVKALKDSGADEDTIQKKVHEFYTALTGDKKTEATEKLKGACRHFFKDTFGAATVEEFKQMKESGSSVEEISKKVEELISKISDEKKKAKAAKASVNCKKLFVGSRKRRAQHDDFAAYKEYFTWLTPEQGAEVKALMASGADEETVQKKVHDFYAALTGDKKTEATEKLKGACRHFFRDTFGAAKVEEFKEMKESGSSVEDISKKVEELIAKIGDEKKKADAAKHAANCKKLFVAPARKRRDHKHTIEEAMTEFLPWLSDAQQAEIKSLKESGAEEKIGEKIMEFFDNVDASKKEEAKHKLQAGCRHYIKHLIGAASAEEMKALHESGATPQDMSKKLDDIIAKMDDGADKKKAEGMSKNCKKVYGVASRKRRHEHTLEEGFTEFLPWITEEQKMELKEMKESGAEEKMGEKIMEYYDNVDASKKEEAKKRLQAGCRHYLKSLIGDSAAEEMKMLKETGATDAEMAKQLDQIIGKLPDGADKKKAERMSKNCKKVYGVVSRKRRHEHTLDEGLTEFLPWITEEQKMELKEMKEAGAQDKIGDKVIEYFENVDASKKDEARTKLQAGCRHYLKHLLGDAVAGEMKAMHESGASNAEMAKALEEIIGKMEDGEKKAKAERLSANCRKVYGVETRKRRNLYGEYDERYQKYYSWLKDEQKEELAELQDSGEDDELLDKVAQYFKDLEDAKKDEARGQLKMGCRMRMRDLLGEEKADEIRRMKDEGATKGEMLDKVAQFVEEMGEGEEKESARRSYRHCAKILGRQRRNSDKPNFADYTKWLKPEQRNELNDIIRSEQISSDEIYAKLFEYLNQLEGAERTEAAKQMKGACNYFLETFLGKQQANKLRQMKETGKRWNEIEQMIDQMIKLIENPGSRTKAQIAIGQCKPIWTTTNY